ncbi:hypothetical protein OGH69_17845 [Flavobacterium sp. MFBS3-15]|uniref:hypothetical protein n=1 Tax=Flavobacterium sp. MFBS3-15 TaxID=2989816 RepID=UPI0022364436|nr:hypothetical protein [Flavobacterium sp. MFBS3-15]MCW4470837.1 hypothetical protein [Flavobacterium sp. MFBS3-15]
MKKLLHVTGIFITLFLFTTGMSAQERSPESGAKLMSENMKEKLALDDSQYQKAYDVNLEFLNAAKALKESEGRKLEKAKKLKTLSEERDKKMKAFLSENQYSVYLQIKEENKVKIKKIRAERH